MSGRAGHHRYVALAALPVCGGALLSLAVFAALEPTRLAVAIAVAAGAFAGGAAAAAASPRVSAGQAAVAGFVFAAIAVGIAGGADLHRGWGYDGREVMLERVASFGGAVAVAAFLGALLARWRLGERVAGSDAVWVAISLLLTGGALATFVCAVGVFRVLGIDGAVVPATSVALFVSGTVAAGYLVQALAPRRMPRIAASGTFLIVGCGTALVRGARAASAEGANDAGYATGAAVGAILGGLLFAWVAKLGADWAWSRRRRARAAASAVPAARAVD